MEIAKSNQKKRYRGDDDIFQEHGRGHRLPINRTQRRGRNDEDATKTRKPQDDTPTSSSRSFTPPQVPAGLLRLLRLGCCDTNCEQSKQSSKDTLTAPGWFTVSLPTTLFPA